MEGIHEIVDMEPSRQRTERGAVAAGFGNLTTMSKRKAQGNSPPKTSWSTRPTASGTSRPSRSTPRDRGGADVFVRDHGRLREGQDDSAGARVQGQPRGHAQAVDAQGHGRGPDGTLRGKARVKRTMWSRRAQEYAAKINSGNPVSIAEVIRDLHRNASQPDQSYSERQIYEAALERLARELAAVEKIESGLHRRSHPRPAPQRQPTRPVLQRTKRRRPSDWRKCCKQHNGPASGRNGADWPQWPLSRSFSPS